MTGQGGKNSTCAIAVGTDFDSFAWMKGGGLCMPGADSSARLPHVGSGACADYYMPDCGTDPCTIAPLIGMPLALTPARALPGEGMQHSVVLLELRVRLSIGLCTSVPRHRECDLRRASRSTPWFAAARGFHAPWRPARAWGTVHKTGRRPNLADPVCPVQPQVAQNHRVVAAGVEPEFRMYGTLRAVSSRSRCRMTAAILKKWQTRLAPPPRAVDGRPAPRFWRWLGRAAAGEMSLCGTARRPQGRLPSLGRSSRSFARGLRAGAQDPWSLASMGVGAGPCIHG